MRRLIIVMILGILLPTLSCKKEPKVYRIGVVISLSGADSGYGQSVKNGLTLAMNEINEKGGIHGKPVDMLIEDDESDEKTAVLKTDQLIRSSGVPIIIGGVTSSVALAIAPLCETNKVVLLSPTASTPKLSTAGSYVFRNYPSDTLEGHLMSEYAVRRMKIASVAILSIDNEYGHGVTDVFKQRFQELRGTVLYEKYYLQGTQDFSSYVKEFKQTAPDAVYLPGYYSEIASILKEVQKQKVSAKLISVEGVVQPMILEIAGDAAEGLVYPQPPYDPESKNPDIQHFVSAYRAKFPTMPDIDAAFAYDAMRIAAKAIETSTNYPLDLQARIADTGMKGITGDISFDENGDVNIEPQMFQIKEGKFTPLQ